VLLSNSRPVLLSKAVRSVAKGEIWIDKQTFKNLLNGINALSKDKDSRLTDREKEIIFLTGEGFRNKEIAKRLNLSEPTVKTHLSHIFQKLNIKTRAELISYAIKNSDINNSIGRPLQ
jgi:DNA-binding NarL/FixJ family response regulator